MDRSFPYRAMTQPVEPGKSSDGPLLSVRINLDFTSQDVGLDLVDLGFQVSRDSAGDGRETHTAVL